MKATMHGHAAKTRVARAKKSSSPAGAKGGSSLHLPVWQPHLVLLIAMVLPGMGQVLNRAPMRGLLMLFFMIMLALISHQLTTPNHSVLGRFAGGWFIYAISIMDAYQWARYRWEIARRA